MQRGSNEQGWQRTGPLLLDLVTGVVAVPPEQIGPAIADAQARLVEALGLERGVLVELEECSGNPVLVCSSGTSPHGEDPSPYRPEECPICQKVLRGEFVRLPGKEGLRTEAASEPETIRAPGCKSVLGFPLSDGGKVLGAVIFTDSREQHAWSAELTAQLEFVARLFGSALARKRAVRSGQLPEAQCSELLESIRAIVWRLDAATLEITFISKATESILGYPREDWLKPREVWAEKIHPEDRERVADFLVRASYEEGDHNFEHRVIAADGRTVWLENVAHVVFSNGHARELVGVSFDITARKRLQERQQRSEAFVNCMFESLHDELVVLDQQGVIIAVNETWNRFAQENGINPTTVSHGVNYLEVCRRAVASGDAVAGQALEAIEAVLQGSRDHVLLEYPCHSPTVSRWFVMRVTPFRDAEGGVVVGHADITPIRGAQESLRQALAEVEALKNKLQEENVYLRQKATVDNGHHRIIGQSQALRRVLAQVEQVAPTDSTVLLLGETGTGKELVAASIHALSARCARTLVSVNCAAMPGALVESELFGREKGAFTGSLSRQVGRFELADGSTIFLDEVGELPLDVQSKLLRVLEAKQIERLGNPRPVPVNVRIIAATNRDLQKAVADGKFRQDLFYRLNVFPVEVPPLRERREDIPLLVWAFVDEFAKTFNKNIESVERQSLDALQRYPWPGNIRELRNLIERAMIVATGSRLRIQLPAAPTLSPSTGGRKMEEVEREHILSVLEKSGWRVRGPSGAAECLGLKPTTLEARMAKLGIRRPGVTSGV